MSALLVAIFEDYGLAEHTRVGLIQDGFPTDRVELTAACELGRAGLEPADSVHGKFVQYFRSVLAGAQERDDAESIAERLENGAAVITVHPRGSVEIVRASKILTDAGPVKVVGHDLARDAWEHAADAHEVPWIRNFLPHSASKADCIYCRLFESDLD